MAYEIIGTIKKIYEAQTFPSGFSKREFVITTEDRFPQDIKLECLKEKGALLDAFAEGERVRVSFDLAGREYNGRYFVNLNAWRIDPANGSTTNAPQAENVPDDHFPEDTTDYGSKDDIPF